MASETGSMAEGITLPQGSFKRCFLSHIPTWPDYLRAAISLGFVFLFCVFIRFQQQFSFCLVSCFFSCLFLVL
jgi:hypothetical protein